MMLALFLLVAQISSAREVTFNKNIETDSLEKNLRDAGFEVESTTCLGARCVLKLPDSETKNPAAVIAAEPIKKPEAQVKTERRALIAEMENLDLDTANEVELRRAVKILKLLLRIK